MTVKDLKRKCDVDHGEAIKLIDIKFRYVGHAEHRNDWDDAEILCHDVIRRDGFPDFHVVTI